MTDTTAHPIYPLPRTCPFAPPPEYAELREHSPVATVALATGRTARLFTRHDDVRAALASPHLSSDRTRPGFPRFAQGADVFDKKALAGFLLGMDPPEHTVHRRMLTGEFTVRRVASMRPAIQAIIDRFLDEMIAGPRPADLVKALSLPVPSLVICELLGVPYADRDRFHAWSRAIIARTTSPEDREAALAEIRGYIGGLVDAKDRDPGEDLMSRLVVRYREEDVYDREILTGLGFILLVAGHETTANMISLGTVSLLEDPERLATLRADPSKTPALVEELLRYWSIVDAPVARVALEDVEINGTLIREGEGVYLSPLAANHDPARYPDPDALDPERGAARHVAFGYGIHQCLGQNLARVELELTFNTLFARLPKLRPAAPAGELPYKHDAGIYGIHELPVTW